MVDPPGAGGMFARDAVPLWMEVAGSRRRFASSSANGRSRLSARWIEARSEGVGEPVLFDLSGAIGRRHMRLQPGVGTEILWSPRGDALLVTTSGGGLNGIYDLILVDRFHGLPREQNLSAAVRERFGHPLRCDHPEPPNVAAIAWLPNGNILAAAEIVHHSVCDSYGTFAAYEIDPTDLRIVRRYDQIEAKRRFGPLLGWELAEAPDRCVRQPGQCRVADGYNGA